MNAGETGKTFFARLKERRLFLREKWGFLLYPALFFLTFFFLDFTFRLHYRFDTVSPFHLMPGLFDMGWIFLFFSLFSLIPARIRRIAVIVLTVLFTAFETVNAVIFNVSGHFFSFSDIAFAEDGAAFMSWQYLAIPWTQYLCFAVTILLGVAASLMIPDHMYRGEKDAPLFRRKWMCVVLHAVLALSGLVAVLVPHLSYAYASGTEENFKWTDTFDLNGIGGIYGLFSDTNASFMLCGTYQYLFRSAQVSLAMGSEYEEMASGIEAYFEAHPKSREPNEMTGFFAGKNCIGILLESIDSFLITEEITPNLYALREGGIDFENHYTPLFLSAGTFNTEFAFNCGYFLPATGTTAKTYATGVFPQALPALFRGAGYTANSFHGLNGKYYNRSVVHRVWGYESYTGANNFVFTEHCWKDTTMMQMYEEFTADPPFFSYLITYSGHGPYNETLSMISDPHIERAREIAAESPYRSEIESTALQYEYAIAHAMECDAFVGQLIDRMEADGTLNDTVLVFFTDHWCKYLTDTDFVKLCKGAENTYELCRTPFFIYSKGTEPMTVTKATSSADMLPTIANLFGLEYDPSTLIGADAFGPDGGLVPLAMGVWADENGVVNTLADPALASDPRYAEKTREASWMLSVSWDIIRCNYFSHQNPKTE